MQLDDIKIIVQARTNSTRLPSKIVLEVEEGRGFLHVLLHRLMPLKKHVVVATSNLPNDDVIEKVAREVGVDVFRGSEKNVLDRFVQCARKFNVSKVVRVCADNPFLDIQSIFKMVEEYQGEDYLSFSIKGVPAILTHCGFFAELISVRALEKILFAGQPGCVEHVTNCIYSNPNKFDVKFISIDNLPTDVRCTLDTGEDFETLKAIYLKWYKERNKEQQNYLDLIAFLENNPTLISRMKSEIKKNEK